MVLDVQKPEPALLAHRERDEATELDELGLGEMLVKALPERVVGVEPPRDRLGVRERRLLAVGEPSRFFEFEEVAHVVLDHALGARLDRALVAAILALD